MQRSRLFIILSRRYAAARKSSEHSKLLTNDEIVHSDAAYDPSTTDPHEEAAQLNKDNMKYSAANEQVSVQKEDKKVHSVNKNPSRVHVISAREPQRTSNVSKESQKKKFDILFDAKEDDKSGRRRNSKRK